MAVVATTDSGLVTDANFLETIHENIGEDQEAVWSDHEQRLRNFARRHAEAGRRVCLVTSGGTTVPLERHSVRSITNFSTGGRGSALTESLLARGCAVIFLHKHGSMRPFHRFIQSDEHPLASLDSRIVLEAAAALKEHHDCLVTVHFDTVIEYLHRLRGIAKLLGELRVGTPDATPRRYSGEDNHEVDGGATGAECKWHHGSHLPHPHMSHPLHRHSTDCQTNPPADYNRGEPHPPAVFLAAAVSDYYVPYSQLPEHKICGVGDDGTIQLRLWPVPKVLGLLKQSWCPQAVVVSFKLETDREELETKALANLRNYSNDAVIANLLQSYKRRAVIYFATARRKPDSGTNDSNNSDESRPPHHGKTMATRDYEAVSVSAPDGGVMPTPIGALPRTFEDVMVEHILERFQ